MKRRTLLQWFASAVASLPLHRVRLYAQPRELTPAATAMLHEVAPTVLPSALGVTRTRAIVERFAVWARDYREGVPLEHGYGHPRLRRSGPTPVPAYIAQLAALDEAARAAGGRWETLDVERRRVILDAALTSAGVQGLPPRPTGLHVVSDLMALYFRSSEANDDCYNAAIGRETCRPIAVTIRRPEPLSARAERP